MKKTIALILAGLVSLAAIAATRLDWDPNNSAENVGMYVLEHRPHNSQVWQRVEIAGSQTTVTIPEEAYGRWFRMAAVNGFGQGEWTTPVRLPDKIKNLRIVLEITP